MSSNKYKKKKFATDYQTDYLFDYYMNSTKIDESKKGELDEEFKKKIENYEPKLDNAILPDNDNNDNQKSSTDSPNRELPSNTISSNNVEFDTEESSSSKSIYKSKVDAKNSVTKSVTKSITKNTGLPNVAAAGQTLLGNKLIDVTKPTIKTPEEKRAEARDYYVQLQKLVEKHGIVLTKHYTINDDPEELRAELEMQKARRNRENHLKIYGNIFISVIYGIEFLNDRYNPFEFKLEGWSKQVGTDLNEYVDVIEEIMDKYRGGGMGHLAPELRLFIMIIFSAFSFHFSKMMMSNDGGLNSALLCNPGMIKGLMNGIGNKPDETPQYTGNEHPDNSNILNSIRNRNANRQTSDQQNQPDNNRDLLSIEQKQKDMLLEKQRMDDRMRKYEEEMIRREEELRRREHEVTKRLNERKTEQSSSSDDNIMEVLSDAKGRPRFATNPIATNIFGIKKSPQSTPFREISIGSIDSQSSKSGKSPKTMKTKPVGQNLDEVFDDLESSNLDDLINSISQKHNSDSTESSSDVKYSHKKKPSPGARQSVRQSVTKSVTRKKQPNTSETASVSKRKKIITL